MINYHIRQGILEIYCGPVKSGKTREILNRLDKIKYLDNCKFKIIKPSIDTRDNTLTSRFGSLSFNCHFVDEKNPQEILDLIDDNLNLLIIDEIQFFSINIVEIINSLIKKKVHVFVAGLDTDFRGEEFGEIFKLMSMATKIHKLSGICDFPNCNNLSLRSQRLVDGRPAFYNESLTSIDQVESIYESRCLEHHFVPKK